MPEDQTLKQQWVDLSTRWIREMRDGPNANRCGLLDPPMLAACGDVTGKRILDSGCGEGRFCRMLASRGAKRVLGIDACAPMIAAARELQGENDEYELGDVQDLSHLEAESFDLAVSYLNQCDLPRWRDNTRAIWRLLKSGGRFIVANLHPMRSAVGHWQKDETGKKLHVILDDYFAESERDWMMMGVEFTNFHRTLETYYQGYREAGFLVDRIIEPTATKEAIERYPELRDELRVPNFIVFVLRKENGKVAGSGPCSLE